jgi:putative endonuclease
MVKGFTYILTNKNFSVIYIGATKDLKYRIDCHRDGIGAVFTKKYNATILIYFEEYDDFHDAFAREKQLKNWRKEWKWNLVKSLNPDLKDLYLEL